jgi:hypothetical protein
MPDIRQWRTAFQAGDAHAARVLPPRVDDERRPLPAVHPAHEKSGQTLDATSRLDAA